MVKFYTKRVVVRCIVEGSEISCGDTYSKVYKIKKKIKFKKMVVGLHRYILRKQQNPIFQQLLLNIRYAQILIFTNKIEIFSKLLKKWEVFKCNLKTSFIKPFKYETRERDEVYTSLIFIIYFSFLVFLKRPEFVFYLEKTPSLRLTLLFHQSHSIFGVLMTRGLDLLPSCFHPQTENMSLTLIFTKWPTSFPSLFRLK